METLQRLFWRSTFNPLVVFLALLLAFFAFQANAAERVILIILAVLLVVAETWRAAARARHASGADAATTIHDADGPAPGPAPTTGPSPEK